MKTLIINAYKVMPANGSPRQFALTSNHADTSGCSSVKYLAEAVNGCIKSFTEAAKGESVSVEIDLKPIRDIVKGPNTGLMYQSPLNAKERKDFWAHLIKE